jgi:hypothetical protein
MLLTSCAKWPTIASSEVREAFINIAEQALENWAS